MQFQNYLCKKTHTSSYPHLSWAHNWCLRASTMKSGLCNEEFINAGLDCAFVAADFAFLLQELSRNRVGKWASPSIPAPSLSPSRPSIKFFVFHFFGWRAFSLSSFLLFPSGIYVLFHFSRSFSRSVDFAVLLLLTTYTARLVVYLRRCDAIDPNELTSFCTALTANARRKKMSYKHWVMFLNRAPPG